MSNRIKGTLLLIAGILVVGGVNNGALPVLSFWLGLILYPIGGYLFLKGNREAGQRLERRVQRALRPTIRSQSAKASVAQQVDRAGGGFGSTERQQDTQASLETPAAVEASATPETPLTSEVSLTSEVPAMSEPPTSELPQAELLLEEVAFGSMELELDSTVDPEDDPDFKVSVDVSFPVEVQERRSIADELRKLVRLFEDGDISDQEFYEAKAKLLN